MTQEKTITRPAQQETEVIDSGGGPSAEGPNPLLQQAAEYRNVAKKALDDCQRGAQAARELSKRRNRSGQ